MELKKFISLFADQFDDTPSDQFNPDTTFRELDEWDSMTALSVIAMIDEEFDKQISGDDIRNVSTIKELYGFIQSL